MAPRSELRPTCRPRATRQGSHQMVPEPTRNMSSKLTRTLLRVQRHSALPRLRDEIRSPFRYFSNSLYKADISRVPHRESDHDPTLNRHFSAPPCLRGRRPLRLRLVLE